MPDATTLEANAALRSIVRRDTGEGYEEFLTQLAKASGIGTPTRADLARLERLLVHASAFNLGLWMRTRFGVGTPRSLQGRVIALGATIAAVWALIDDARTAVWSQHLDHTRSDRLSFELLLAVSVL